MSNARPVSHAAAVMAMVVLTGACGAAPDNSSHVAHVNSGAAGPTHIQVREAGQPASSDVPVSPPPFRVAYPGHELRLHPHTWCYRAGCVDGVAPDPPSVGTAEELHVYVPLRGWHLTATFTPEGARCGRLQSVEPARVEDGTFVLRPAGHADKYDVDLFAQGPGGDMVARLRWTTPQDGPLPTPSARLSVIAEHDGEPDSYGVELAVDNLAATPHRVQAHIAITAASGRSHAFDATRARQLCRRPGSLYFDGPDAAGKVAARLGSSPFTYVVVLTLDGTIYRATARYPRDVIVGNEPSVALSFTPDLPAPR